MWYRPARVRARRRRALTAIPEAGQFVLSARFVMPAVVLSIHHCIAATNTTTTATTTKKSSPSAAAAAVTIAAAAAAVTAGNNSTTTTTTTTHYWLPVLDSPVCFYCGGRLFVVGGATTSTTTGNHTTGFGSISSCSSSSSSSSSGVNNCFDAYSLPSCNFGSLCRCDGAVVLLVPYVLGPPPCFRPFVLPPAFVADANHLSYHRRKHHLLYNTAVVGNNMETR